jgi:hypothetical protein
MRVKDRKFNGTFESNSGFAAAVDRGFRVGGERYHDRHRVQESTA